MSDHPLSAARAEQVWDALAREVRVLPPIEIDAANALNFVTAADVRAAFDFPPFDRSAMDGFAVRRGDFTEGQAVLRRAGLVRAGDAATERVEPGACMQINTGAPVPPGADAVVIVENSETLDGGAVRLRDEPRPMQNIEPRGGIVRAGDLLIRGGTRIGPGALAALIAGGAQRIAVFARPRAAVLSTGDEIIPPGEHRGAAQVFDSNGAMLGELVMAARGAPLSLGRCPDDADKLRELFEQGLKLDVLCVTGGMSKGSHDLAPGVLEELGVTWLVRSLHLKPGKPMRIGRGPGGCWVLGLPGNPVSCAVCFLLFGRPILDGLQGLPVRPAVRLKARLTAPMPRNGKRPLYQPAEWHAAPDGTPAVTPLPWRGSGDPFGMTAANALIHREEQAEPACSGEMVSMLPLDVPQ
jgi:molybdopterin molybdotransferase